MRFREYLSSYKHLFESPLRYIHAYRNAIPLMMHIVRNKFPFQAILKNGKKIIVHNYYEAYLASFGIMEGYSINGNIITISNDGLPETKLDLENNNGDPYAVFFAKVYDFLPVRDKVIIDIGANIGDSSIYFVHKGAKKVIALEPFPKNYNTAKKNIELNNLTNKISLLPIGCSGTKGEITINPKQEGAGSALDSVYSGIKVHLTTLDELIHEHNVPDDSVMKIDCEGCETDVILSSSKQTLRKFTHIEIEYHYGYKDLKQKLDDCGFLVTISPPLFLRNRQSDKSMYFGYLYAKRI